MLSIEQIKMRLKDANLKRVAESAGIHYTTIYRFMKADAHPLYDTVVALSDYLEKRESHYHTSRH